VLPNVCAALTNRANDEAEFLLIVLWCHVAHSFAGL
jgi:hypothetical protein